MRLKLLVLLFLFIISSVSAKDDEKSMHFKNSSVDLGKIGIKETKNAIFYFENRGDKPFVILEAKSSCGCTSVKYNRKPIVSTKRDSILVKFKPSEEGIFYKKIEIKNSAGESQILVIKGSAK